MWGWKMWLTQLLMLMKFLQLFFMIIMSIYCDLCSQDLSFVHISFPIIYWINTMKKMGILQLALQLNFWIVEDICNSLYLYVVNVKEQVAWVAELQFTVYMVQFIITQLQLNQNNSFSTTTQLHYNYTHDVMLMSLIVIHLLKSNMCYYEDFWT